MSGCQHLHAETKQERGKGERDRRDWARKVGDPGKLTFLNNNLCGAFQGGLMSFLDTVFFFALFSFFNK